MESWDVFCMTGSVNDYLNYRASLEGELDENAKRTNNSREQQGREQ